jgi:hypothetical protein
MGDERFDHTLDRLGVPIDPQVGVQERAYEPRPHGALVVGAVAFDGPSLEPTAVSRFLWSKGAEPERREQMLGARIDHASLAVTGEGTVVKRNGE